jgi:hypothetical protein
MITSEPSYIQMNPYHALILKDALRLLTAQHFTKQLWAGGIDPPILKSIGWEGMASMTTRMENNPYPLLSEYGAV